MQTIQVKICGITNLEDARVAIQAGADYLGFVMYAKSPRYVTPEQVKAMVEALRAEYAQELRKNDHEKSLSSGPFPALVGVFVNVTGHRIAQILDETGLDYAQLHGAEPPIEVERLAGRGYKAISPTSVEMAVEMARWYAHLGVPEGPQLLIDAHAPGAYGGTGARADWHAAAAVAERYPRVLLAGGLTPDNVAEAIRAVRPWGVDVSSGVEAEPGKKDPEKIRAFVAAAKSGA